MGGYNLHRTFQCHLLILQMCGNTSGSVLDLTSLHRLCLLLTAATDAIELVQHTVLHPMQALEYCTTCHLEWVFAVRFGPGDNFELVAIEERPVIARYYGLGQINASTQL